MGGAKPSGSKTGLPLVVQLGFAGSRFLFDRSAHPQVNEAKFHDAVEAWVTKRLGQLSSELGLKDCHFFCGISQLAIGADTIFTRACQTLQWRQRLFLPQNHEDFLAARGTTGTPDFDASQQATARQLLASPHLIQERVVSDSPDRRTRFEDVNLELVRVSDVMVSLIGSDAGKTGGSTELVEEADRRKCPLLDIRVHVGTNGEPRFTERWRHQERFSPPELPEELSGLQTGQIASLTASQYCQQLKSFASAVSKVKQDLFRVAALVIIGTHVAATALAVVALQKHGDAVLPWLVGAELVLLALGFGTHWYLHRSRAVRVWAMSRLVAEVARSGVALSGVTGYLSHLFSLALPSSIRPLVRTLNVLHLEETRVFPPASWSGHRDAYVERRFKHEKTGQIKYYSHRLERATRWLKRAQYTFRMGSGVAMLITFSELVSVLHVWPAAAEFYEHRASVLATTAILLPVLAVAALSLAASFDLEARVHTYDEMLTYLRRQESLLGLATSERAFCRLAMETEARLLGETAGWYSRRAFTGIS
jgi:hypothetical protein